MDALTTWAKENYDLICLLVGIVGVAISIACVIIEIKKKRNRKK